MKKRIYLLVTVLLSLFIFAGRVEAAKELTCAYEGVSGYATMITQDSSGKISFYYYFYNENNKKRCPPIGKGFVPTSNKCEVLDDAWSYFWQNDKDGVIDLTFQKDKNSYEVPLSNLDSCPKYATMYNNYVTKIKYSSDYNVYDYGASFDIYEDIYYQSNTFYKNEKAKFEGLACIYDGNGQAYNKMLLQDTDGSKYLFIDKNNMTLSSDGYTNWQLKEKINLVFYDIDDQYLTKCPSYSSVNDLRITTGDVSFWEVNGTGAIPLTKSYDGYDGIDPFVLEKIKNKEKKSNSFELKKRNTFSNSYDYLGDAYYKDEKWKGKCVYGIEGNTIELYFNDKNYILMSNRIDVLTSPFERSISHFDTEDLSLFDYCPTRLYEGYYEKHCSSIMGCTTQGIGEYSLVSRKNFFANISGYKEDELLLIVKDSVWYDDLIEDDEEDIDSCRKLLGDEVIKIINDIMKWVKIIIPILLIGYGTLDFTKAIFSGKEDDMVKLRKKFINRIIAAVLVFIAPIVINLILSLANEVWSFINPNTCVSVQENE